MAEERVQRRLAAILVADVVGYSRLMQADDAGTMAALKGRRNKILQPMVAKYHGRVVKLMGDGVLVEFASAVDAVACAVDLQAAMDSANTGVAEDRRIVLRVGINLGDVIVEGSDLYGDGVNIAARLEARAEPGSVCVSGKVRNEVGNKLNVGFDDLGEHSLKNMAEPIRVYRVSSGSPGAMTESHDQALLSKPSIAVLPFANMSGDPEQQYFADGITEDIITELSRFSSLFVIARNSSFRYRNRSLDIKQVGRELGARYVVEGSVRRLGPRIRITAQLIDAITGRHLWAEHYDRKIDDLFEVQDEVVRAVVTTSEHRIADIEAEQGQRKPPHTWLAYDYFLQARHYLAQYGNYSKAEAPLRRAVELDSHLAEAYSKLAHVSMAKYWLDIDADESHIKEAWRLAKKALSINDKDSRAHAAMAIVSAYRDRFDLAWLHSDRALALNPNDVTAANNRAVFQIFTGKCDEALAALDSILQRDPFPTATYWEARGTALFQLRRYQEAIEAFDLIAEPQFWERAYVVAAFALSERLEEARLQLKELMRSCPTITISRIRKNEIYKDEGARNHFVDGLRKAGLPE
jgi:adenylate cyclase